MSTIADRLEEEYINERKIGISQGISQIIKRMLKMNVTEEFIKKATGASKKQIEKVKKEIKSKN